MIPQELIRIKRDGGDLSATQLEDFFGGYMKGEVTDYQMSAMLMAILLEGASDEETVVMTRLSHQSGISLDWGRDSKLIIDKHSTGGIGDKTSLVLLPLCTLMGLTVPMMSGRGLGHTGGTLDKLEAIPGMNVFPDETLSHKIVDSHGGVFLGQTKEIAPLDRRLYALRDVTATVESIPLIVMSILAKKLAEGIGGLVLDVKHGSGAFMQDYMDAKSLAEGLVSVGKGSGLNVSALITNMSSPLGRAAGNSLEVAECLDIMNGNGPQDTRELTLQLAVKMVQLADSKREAANIYKELEDHLDSGRVLERFSKIIADQGGDVNTFDKIESYRKAPIVRPITFEQEGIIEGINVRDIGVAVVDLGGGRKKTTDVINHAVGFDQLKKVGERLEKDEPLGMIYAADEQAAQIAEKRVKAAYQIGRRDVEFKLINELVE